MKTHRAFGALALVPLVLQGCDEGPTNPSLPPLGLVDVRTNLAFDDPPLVGRLTITPRTEDAWRYEVDLDADGRPDEAGRLGLGVSIGYRFERSGSHPIAVTLTRNGERHRLERMVVVNQGGAVVERSVQLEGRLSTLAFDPGSEDLLVMRLFRQDMVRIDRTDLSVRGTIPLADNTVRSAIRSDVVVDDVRRRALVGGGGLLAIPLDAETASPDTLIADVFFRELEFLGGDTLLAIYSDAILQGGLARVSLADDAVRLPRHLASISRFTVSPDGSRIVAAVGLGSRFSSRFSLAILDALTLEIERSIELEVEGRPVGLHVHPDGEKAYLVLDDDGTRLLVVELDSGDLLRDLVLDRDEFPVMASILTSPDGGHVILCVNSGIYWIDPETELPGSRIKLENLSGCDMATGSDPGIVFVSSRSGGLARLRAPSSESP